MTCTYIAPVKLEDSKKFALYSVIQSYIALYSVVVSYSVATAALGHTNRLQAAANKCHRVLDHY